MSSGLLVRRRRAPGINIVPLMDVLTILIFFFLVSMEFRERRALNLTLPRVETAGRNEFQSSVIIGIDREEKVFFNGTPVSDEQLQAAVQAQAAVADDITVLIKAHEETPLNKVTFVMDACRKVGLNKIRLQSR